jgi:hypothetical protein
MPANWALWLAFLSTTPNILLLNPSPPCAPDGLSFNHVSTIACHGATLSCEVPRTPDATHAYPPRSACGRSNSKARAAAQLPPLGYQWHSGVARRNKNRPQEFWRRAL